MAFDVDGKMEGDKSSIGHILHFLIDELINHATTETAATNIHVKITKFKK